MSDLIIKEHNFLAAKDKINKFSKTVPTEVTIEKFKTSGSFFGFTDHNITGDEANDLVSVLQENFIEINKRHTAIIGEFGEIYNAFDSLDKDYIAGILSSVKAAEAASNQAHEAQIDIKKTIDVQQKTITVLQKFKERLDAFEHLNDIDDVWENINTLKQKVFTLQGSLIELKNKIQTFVKMINVSQKELGNITLRIETVELHIRELNQENTTLKEQLDDLNQQIFSLRQQSQDETSQNRVQLQQIQETYDAQIQVLQKKYKIACVISIGSLIISLVSIFFVWGK